MTEGATESRVGVFLCDCGGEISSVLDLARLGKSAHAFDGVVHVSRARYWCSPSGLKRLADTVADESLDAVVVAGCSPRTHGAIVADAVEVAGVNRNRVVLVNLRGHCARVHAGRKSQAATKAARLVRMGVERARTALALDPITAEVERSAVVIGGGITGMTAARALSARGVPVTLLEREAEIGGLLRHVNLMYPTYADARAYVREIAEGVEGDPNVEIVTGSTVAAVDGHVGRYRLSLDTPGGERDVTCGVIVVATGAGVLMPRGLFGYGENPKVVTQIEFEGMLRDGIDGSPRIVMIQCAGSRNDERPYCSRVCCTATVKNTITVMEEARGAEITVLSRGFAQYVGDLDRARDAGVTFLRYDPERPPRVGEEAVEVFDEISSTEKSLPCDLVVLATPLVPHEETAGLARLLNMPVDDFCFVAEPHAKLRPGSFAPSGVFVAGSAHWPATIMECLSQAHAAAARAAALVEAGSIEREPRVALVDELVCRGCEKCVEACAHAAPSVEKGDDGIGLSAIDAIRCVGCGVCVRVCPSSAITLSHMTQEQISRMVGAAVA
jgi:heterodisulfide reductase subunit A